MRQTVFEESLDGITIERIIRDYEFTMPTKHVHDEYEIYYLMEGERFYFIGQHTYHVKKGDLVLVNCGEIHQTGLAGSSYHDRILVEFQKEPFSTFFSSMGDMDLGELFRSHNGVIHLDLKAQHYVESLLFGINTEMDKRAPGYRLSVMMKLSTLLIFAMRYRADNEKHPATASDTAKHRKVDEVATYIIEHCVEDLSLASVSQTFFVSKCYLSRIFKEVTGFTVNEYINIHRIQLAQKLLTETDKSITEIATELGYDSLTYFEKVFKTYRETSPLKYRNDFRKRLQKSRSKKAEERVVMTIQ